VSSTRLGLLLGLPRRGPDAERRSWMSAPAESSRPEPGTGPVDYLAIERAERPPDN